MKTLSIEHAAEDEPGRVSLFVDGRRALTNFTQEDAESVADVLEARHEALFQAVHGVVSRRLRVLDPTEDVARELSQEIVAAVAQLSRD